MTRFLFALVLTGAAPLAAQQQPDTTKKRPPADSVRVLPPIEVVGSIQPTSRLSVGSGVPARVTILTGKQVDAMEPRLLSDVLGQQAGFSTYDDLGNPYKLNVSSRGFFASPVVGLPQGISVFLDGVRQNEPDAAQVNFDLLPMEHIKRIEILSGNGSLLGRNSLGGAINLVTRRGEGPTTGEVELMGGTFGAFSSEANVGGLTKGGVDYYVGGGYNRENGWRQATGAEQYNLFTNLGKLGPQRGIRLQLMAAKSDVKTAGSLPQSVYVTTPDSNLSANDYEHLSNVQAVVSGYETLGNGRASFNTYFRRHRAARFNANQADDPDTFGASQNDVVGGTADYRVAVPVGASALGLRFGVDGSGSRTRVQLYNDSTKFGGSARDQTTNVRSPVWDLGFFATSDITFGAVTLSAGGRYDFVRAPFRNLLDPTKDTAQTFTRFNPRAGIDVAVGQGVSLFGSWGQAFRAPSVIEIACADPNVPCPLPFALGDDPPIKPVTTTTWEAGVRYQRGLASFSASAYRTNLRNEIVLLPYTGAEPGGSTINGYFGNIDRTRREGVEASLTVATRWGAFGYVNYAYTRATFQVTQEIASPRIDEALGITNTVTPGSRFPLVPDHQAKAGVQVPFLKRFSAGVDGRYIGKQYLRGDEANQDLPLNSYFVADARVGATYGPWTINIVGNNIFDNRYAVFGTYNINQGNPRGPTLERFLTPGYARQVRFIVRRSFGAASED